MDMGTVVIMSIIAWVVVSLRQHIEAHTGMGTVVAASSEQHAKSRKWRLHQFHCTVAFVNAQAKVSQLETNADHHG